MFNRDCIVIRWIYTLVNASHTFNKVTRSAAWSSVSPDISSTILEILGSVGRGGGGGAVDWEGCSVAVANHRRDGLEALDK